MDLKTLSDTLKLSPTTVSRALGGYPEVSETTRKRVVEAAEQMGYRPNARAKGLATGRSMVIGHVLPPATQHEMVNPIFGDFVAGASRVYAKHNYDMMFSRVSDGAEETAYRALLSEGAIDGVIIQGPWVDDSRIELLTRLGLPFVVHGRSSGVGIDYSWVDINNLRAFQRATEFLIHLGHTRIGLINGLVDMDFAYRRQKGYEAALKNSGLAVDAALIQSSEMTEIYGYRATSELLSLPHAPSAILCSSMISAIGVRRAIHERGLVMGRDISVITHDDELSYLSNGDDVPIFTAMRSSVAKAGEIVAQMLIDRITMPTAKTETRMLEAELVVGASTGPFKGN